MKTDFRPAIRRALQGECESDFLKLLAPRGEGFAYAVKTRLIERGESVTELADKIGWPRNSVALVIHQRRRMPKVERAIRKELGLEAAETSRPFQPTKA